MTARAYNRALSRFAARDHPRFEWTCSIRAKVISNADPDKAMDTAWSRSSTP